MNGQRVGTRHFPEWPQFGRAVRGLALLTALSALAPSASGAQEGWPSKPITVVVPFAPGGGGDTLARLVTTPLGENLGQPLVVENRAGAGGNIGTTTAARATPDGYALAYGTNGTMAANHSLYKNPGFAIGDFEPVARFTVIGLALVVSKESEFKTAKDLIDFARRNPKQLTCASAGNGTTSHLACGMLSQLAGIQLQHVPYKGGAAAVVDVRGGRVSFIIDVLPNLTGQIQDGSLRALATSMAQRVDALPDVPTFAESGVAGYEIFAWDGLFAPKGTPPDRLDKLNAAVNAVLSDGAFRKNMRGRGATVEPMSRAEFAAFVQSEYRRLGEVVRNNGIAID